MLTAMLLAQCANVVTPTGGPKDSKPPIVVKASPENHSVNFIGKKIEITFDEYITLENANQNMLISPPLNEKPSFKLNNKTVVIKFNEPLLPNTTYTIHFGSAVKDLHEGNIFNNYIYSFSTGELLDTLQISGKVLDAENKKPLDDLYVGVYACDRDSLFDQPTRVAPDYLTKTDKEGKFSLHGLPDKRFLVVALKDMNSNLFYDMPNETVTFLDTLVPASYPQLAPKVTDSLDLASDTVVTKSFDQNALDLTLYAFIEKDTTQMLLEKKLVEEGVLRFSFRQPADSVFIETAGALPDSFQIVPIWSERRDTLWWYFTPEILDSLQVVIQHDTLINDSTRYSLKYRETKQQGKKASKALKISNNLKNNLLMPDEDFILRFNEPVVRIHWHDTSTLAFNDTVWYNDLPFERADEYGMEYLINIDIIDTINYTIDITDSVFYSVRGRTNDSIHMRFTRALEKDLGNIFITVVPPENTQVVIQLLDSRDRVLSTQIIHEEQRVEFRQLLPEKYKLRAIFDTDGDGQWSSGNYHRRFLPENVEDYKDALDVKAGWDIDLEEKWILFSK